MSFKREGDDPSQLQVLKKRRVAELLANYIPEDEALLLRDGRYSCTVCFKRPVFDTLDMLTVHRSGKKHLASLQKFYGKKRSLENEIQKRQHQAYPGRGRKWHPGGSGTGAIACPNTEDYPECLAENPALQQLLPPQKERGRCQHFGESASFGQPPGMPKPSGSDSVDEERQVEEEASPSARLSSCRRGTVETQKKKSARQGKGRETRKSSEPNDPEKRRILEHYLKLKSSGWIEDGSGKWVKDENVEFDSDEDEPPMLPLS